jgi:hypothetical protein
MKNPISDSLNRDQAPPEPTDSPGSLARDESVSREIVRIARKMEIFTIGDLQGSYPLGYNTAAFFIKRMVRENIIHHNSLLDRYVVTWR